MNNTKKSWVWFVLLMALIIGVGLYLGKSRRTELGKSFDYSLDDYRVVDPALVHYVEVEPLVPTIGPITALTIASDGQIYVCAKDAIEVFPAGGTHSIKGLPGCIAVDDEGMVFVGMQDHVAVFSAALEKQAGWPSPGSKTFITSIAVDDQYVYAADAGSRRIWRYNKDGGEPMEIGSKDAAKGVRGFYVPSPFFDLDIGTDGSLWVVNPGHHALENYRADGQPISSWENSAFTIEGFSGCCNPAHFALMPDGAFVTAEKGLPRVKIHNVDGSFRCVVAAPDQFDDDATGLDVAVDETGRVHVLDPGRNMIRIFEEKE